MNGPTEVDEIVAAALLQDAHTHDAGSYDRIANRYDDVYGEVLPLEGNKARRIAIAFNFWDGWCDASNHEWRYYNRIAINEWPILARHIAEKLRHGEDASDPRVLELFSPEAVQSRRISLWDWISSLWRRSA